MTEKIFDIFRVGIQEAEKIAASANEPHSHDFEELLIGLEGSLEHFIDFRSEEFDAPYISFVTKGKVHKLQPKIKDGKCDVWVIRFRSEFIAETAFQLYILYHENANIILQPGPCFDRLVNLAELMFTENNQDSADLAVIRHLLSALFLMIETDRKKASISDVDLQTTQNSTFRNFLKILEENYHRPLGVDFYAEKLFMTSRNLNLICRNILQQSVSEIIETRKLIEAKNLLTSTDKTISEISFELGYNENSYFTNVFRKKTGQTPGEFREEMKKLLS
ncbi:MAG TPA: AraC family transcriptional regulator [Bacteroidales bacterium]|nr:AraC family transcriptional regulator [Bacteroidales bacterium]